MNWTNLLTAMCFKLFPELFCVGVGREEVHLTIIAAIHLTKTETSLYLHFLQKHTTWLEWKS
jgi:hypothetical protein